MAADGWADGRGGRLAAGWLWNLGDEEGESVVRDWDRAVGLDEGCEVHVRRFAMEDLPREDAELAKWLETRWLEKGQWLEQKRRSWSMEPAT